MEHIEYIVGNLALCVLIIIANLLYIHGSYTRTRKTTTSHKTVRQSVAVKRYQRKHKALHKCAERSRHRKKSEYIQACWDEIQKPRNR